MQKIKAFFRNKWTGFVLASAVWTLWFVVWTGNWWMLLGIPVLYDLYITGWFRRRVWSRNAEWCRRSAVYRTAYEWVNAILFATVVATLVHIYVFQMYVIPTSSMEKTLLVGDYLYVSKVTYGPQMPNTPLSFPFVHHTMPFSQTRPSFSDAVQWPYRRLRGLRRIERNDVVVFNFPAGDTVLLENQAVTYYDVLRSYCQTYGDAEGRRRLFAEHTLFRPMYHKAISIMIQKRFHRSRHMKYMNRRGKHQKVRLVDHTGHTLHVHQIIRTFLLAFRNTYCTPSAKLRHILRKK